MDIFRRIKRIIITGLERNVRNAIEALYQPEYAALDKRFSPMLEFFHAWLSLQKNRTWHLVHLEGIDPVQKEPVKVLFAALEDPDWDETMRYIWFLLTKTDEFRVGQKVTCTGRRVYRLVEQMSAGCDLVFLETSRASTWRPRQGQWVITPMHVRMVVDFDPGEDWDHVRKRLRSQRQNIRRFRLSGYTHRFGTAAELDTFYRCMYLPLVNNRHGRFAYIEEKKTLLDWLRHGELLFMVDPSGRDVGGSVSINKGGVKFMMVNGVLNADPELIKGGVLSAIYYTCIRLGFEQGFRRCDFGLTRPFEDDGVFRHKLNWGMKPLRNPWAVHQWLFWSPNGSSFGRRWLNETPFIRSLTRYGGDWPAQKRQSAEGGKPA